MTRDEIEQLVRNAEARYLTSNRTWMYASWIATALAALLLLTELLGIGVIMVLILGVHSVMATIDFRHIQRELSVRRAQFLWANIHRLAPKRKPSLRKHIYSDFPATQQLAQRIERLYNIEPSGQAFPLVQALWVMDVHARQQERVRSISRRLSDLIDLRSALERRVQALEELGSPHASANQALQKLRSDETALQQFRDGIQASCLRLESLVLTVERALQVKTLRSEVEFLTRQAQLESGNASLVRPDDLADLDAQIAREVETYQELERQTDAQLATE